MQVFKVGTYKSAVEPFIATEMSPANREQVTTFITSIWGQVTEGVSTSRNISVDSLNVYADRMLMFYPAEESVKCDLHRHSVSLQIAMMCVIILRNW